MKQGLGVLDPWRCTSLHCGGLGRIKSPASCSIQQLPAAPRRPGLTAHPAWLPHHTSLCPCRPCQLVQPKVPIQIYLQSGSLPLPSPGLASTQLAAPPAAPAFLVCTALPRASRPTGWYGRARQQPAAPAWARRSLVERAASCKAASLWLGTVAWRTAPR